mgnify:CR=1 FL=1
MLDHELRRQGLGGSEIAAVAGLNPWKSPLDVWGEKTGRIRTAEPDLAMQLGTYLEGFIAQQYANRTGFSLTKGQTRQHPTTPWIVGSPDYYVIDQNRGLECKYTAYLDLELWGPPGTDLIPLDYLAQCQWYMQLTGLAVWDLAVLAPRDFRIYFVAYDADLVEMLLETGERFWMDYVLADVQPPLDPLDAAQRYLAGRYPHQILDAVVKADEAAVYWSDTLQMVKGQLVSLEELKTRAEIELKMRIGEAAGIEGEDFLHTWMQTRASKEVDWQAIALELGATPDVIARHTREKPGSRRFLTKWATKES